MSDKCFKKCVYKPGPQLDNSEQVTLNYHCDRILLSIIIWSIHVRGVCQVSKCPCGKPLKHISLIS